MIAQSVIKFLRGDVASGPTPERACRFSILGPQLCSIYDCYSCHEEWLREHAPNSNW